MKRPRFATPASCFGCGSTTIDKERSWVQEQDTDSELLWFVCVPCLERGISVEWAEGVPNTVTYPALVAP